MSISKHERAYQIIRSRIVDGTYGSGYRLVLDALAREFEISPMPVREAVRRLEAEGWVRFRHNIGAEVAPLNKVAWEQAMQTLALLEGYATALAAPEMEAGDIEFARTINESLRATLGSLDALGFSELNRQFHFALFARCNNDYLNGLLLEAWDRLDVIGRSVFPFIPLRAEASIGEHEALIELIETGSSPTEIELTARRHKLSTVSAYQAQRDGELVALAPTSTLGVA